MKESGFDSAGEFGGAKVGGADGAVADGSAPLARSSSSEQVLSAGRDPGDVRAESRRILRDQTIEQVSVGSLKPRARNARVHSKRQIERLAAGMREFGFVGAIVIDRGNNVLAGHGRLAAAKLLGLVAIPCIRVEHLDEARQVAFALADNRLPELSEWDNELLKAELQELDSIPDLDVELTGFDTVDLDRLLGPEPDPNAPSEEVVPELELDKSAVSERGDLWLLGEHRLLCGDARDPDDYQRLLVGEQVTQVVVDPPYNLAIRGHVSSKGFREFAMASGELTAEQFTEFNARWLTNARNVARDGAIFHVFMDWRHSKELMDAATAAVLRMMNLCVWIKAAGMGSFYRSQHELVFVLKHGTAAHINNFGLGGRGRSRSNVWQYPAAVHGKRRGIADPEHGHPTPKPVALIVDALKDCSNRGDIVLDPFAGSGTLAIAAERIGRKARLIELDPRYVDLTVRRWQAVTGQVAKLSTGATFAEVQSARASSPRAELDDARKTEKQ